MLLVLDDDNSGNSYPDRFFVVDSTLLRDELLDSVLAGIADTPETFDTRYWIQRTAEHTGRILVRRLSVSSSAMFSSNGQIMSMLFSNRTPDPRDIAIVGLATASNTIPGTNENDRGCTTNGCGLGATPNHRSENARLCRRQSE